MKPTEETLINEEEENNDVLKDFHMQQKKYAQQKIASKRKTEGLYYGKIAIYNLLVLLPRISS